MPPFGVMNHAFKVRLPKLFGRASAVEAEIDEFLDKITEIGLLFQKAVRVYLEHGQGEEFEQFVAQASAIEHRGDELRRSIEVQLYSQTLIPDLRGDVLGLLERLDCLMNIVEANLYRFSIQCPEIPENIRRDFQQLTDTSVACLDSVVLAARAFFRDIEAVRDHNSKVMFHEHQADLISTRMQRAIFSSQLPLEHKTQLRYFVERVDELANHAEDISDALAIYAIKRRI
jgi:predicted phosphate transport protein (TIGR00153 family)